MSHPPNRAWLALSIRASEHRATVQMQERALVASKLLEAQQASSAAHTRATDLQGAWANYRGNAAFAAPLDAAYRHYAEHLHDQAQEHREEAQRQQQALTDSEAALRQTVAEGRAMKAVSNKLLAAEAKTQLRRSLRQESEDWAARSDGRTLGGDLL
jgi:hypothetical protein